MTTSTPAAPADAPAPTPAPAEGRALPIAEAASATGLSVHTLRYYERDGLMLGAVERAPSGHRRYSPGDLDWLRMVTRLRETGMSIEEIRQYAALVRAGAASTAERLELLREHRRRVLVELERVQEHLRAIDGKISLYESEVGFARA
ncbi:MerR family transcriptional regulator [Cellulomonas sp. PhB143]|uniref:MerR family transcriptional regulator n=1 Tax=Cellulomonas sp. PhB143 TaxID=2485186 RepID=UPI000F464CCA|nr:MerR family transcriptional regulator [Cellulomonas sp. PhB143]ROS73379.1 DNA-binding transcriptional MerR regulator [Cellulomonas sp. PhB143]